MNTLIENNEQPGSLAEQHAAAAGGIELELSQAFQQVDFEGEEELIEEGLNTEAVDPFNNTTHISLLQVAIMVTLDFTNRNIFTGSKKNKIVDSSRGEMNAYSPFKRENRDKDPRAGEGIARPALFKALEIANSVNNSNFTMLGDVEQVALNLDNIASKILNQVELALPFAQNQQVCVLNLGTTDEPHDVSVLMKDIVRVTGWLSSPEVENEDVHKPYFYVVNLTVNAGMFYDSKDLHKYVATVQGNINTAKRLVDVPVVFGIMLRTKDMKIEQVRDMLDILFIEDESHDFELLGRSDLQNNTIDAAWVPNSRAAVDRDLLTSGGDNLLVKVL